MSTGNVTIDFKLEQVSYHLELDSKITFIRGDSGIGKTHLVSELESYFRSYTEGNMYTTLSVSDDYKLVVLPEFIDSEPYDQDRSDKVDFGTFLLKRVGSHDVSKVIFITDERSDYVNSRDFQKAVNSLSSLFIFIDRDPLYSIPYSWGSVKTFKNIGRINILVPYGKFCENNCKSYDSVYTEDSKLGFKFLKLISNNSQAVQTFSGKDYLIRFWKDLRNTLFVVDSLGCGATLCKLMSLIDIGALHSLNDVYLIGSFEHMLLTSEFAKRGNAKSGFVLREPAINEWNVEEFYVKELSRFCVEALKMRRGYHKQDLANCFTEACKSSVEDCKGLLDPTQSSCDYKVPGTLQDKFKTLVPADLYQVLINLKGDSKLTCNQSQVKQSQSHDDVKLSEQLDTNSDKTDSKESESDITTNLFGC